MEILIDFVLVTGILFCSFILYAFIKKKEQYGKIMIIFFILILSVLINYYGYLHKIIALVLPTFILSDCIDVIAGPLFLIYIKSLYSNQKNIIHKNIRHFIFPFLDILFVSIPVLVNLFIDNHTLQNYIDFIDPYAPLTIGYSLIYCTITLNLLYKFRKLLKKNYSNLDNKDLKWMEIFLIGSICVISVDLTTTIYTLVFGINNLLDGYLTASSLVILIVYLGFHGISQSKILIPKHLYESEINNLKTQTSISHETIKDSENTQPLTIESAISNSSKKDYIKVKSTESVKNIKKEKNNNYDHSEMIKMESHLIKVMKDQKPFLMEDLTLRMLSEKLSISDKKLSILLNQFMKKSFYDYINGYRVEEVKQRIISQEYHHYTLLAIAYESGFKSKTSFNRIFKANTGFSPSEFKKKVSTTV